MKKISLMLVIALLASTLTAGIFVSASSSSEKVINEWCYWDSTKSRICANSDLSGTYFYDASGTGSITYYEDGKGISSTPIWDVKSTNFQCDYKALLTPGTKKVLNFGYKIYIPEGTSDKLRQFAITLAKQLSNGSFNNATYGKPTVYCPKSNGLAGCALTTLGYSSNFTPDSFTLNTNAWHQYNIRVYFNETGKITCGIFLNEVLIASYTYSDASKIKFEDFGINYFQLKSNEVDHTYIKDLKLTWEDFNGENEPVESAKTLSSILFNDATYDSTKKVLAPAYANGSGTSASLMYTGDEISEKYKFEDDALKVTLKSTEQATGYTHSMKQAFAKNITDYFPSGKTKYLQLYYDIKISSFGPKNTQWKNLFAFGNNTASLNSGVWNVYSIFQNGKMYFSDSGPCKGTSNISKTVEVSEDKWYRVIYLLKVDNNSASEYSINYEGYLMDIEANTMQKIYDGDVSIPKKTEGTNGLVLSSSYMNLATQESTEDITTYYDNIILKVSETKYSSYYAKMENLLSTYLNLTVDENVATAIGVHEASAGNQKVLIAAYGEGGNLLKLAVNSDSDIKNAEKGKIDFTYDFSNISGIKTIKAFMFNNITDCVPLVNSLTK